MSNLLVESNLSNFLSVLQVSYDAGIPIVECLRLAGLTLDNYFLRDSDWVAIKNLDEDDEFKTDFDIEQKKEIQKKKEEMKKLKSKERSKKVYEKPLRIKLDD